jgi:hypothetical protein
MFEYWPDRSCIISQYCCSNCRYCGANGCFGDYQHTTVHCLHKFRAVQVCRERIRAVRFHRELCEFVVPPSWDISFEEGRGVPIVRCLFNVPMFLCAGVTVL